MGCGASAGKYAPSEPSPPAAEPAPAADPQPAQADPTPGGPEKPSQEETNPEDELEDDEELEQDDLLADLEAVDLDLDQVVTRGEWAAIGSEMGLAPADCDSVYMSIAQEAEAEGYGSVEEGVPLREFLEELKIEYEDLQTQQHIAAAAASARAKLDAGEDVAQEEDVDPRKVDPAVDMIVRELDRAQRPAEDAWTIFEEGKVPLSKAQFVAIESFADKQEELVEKVQTCMLTPPLINSSGGQNACSELCIAEVNKIIEACQAEGTQYTDPDWDMNSTPEAVLYVDREKPGWDCTVGVPAGYKRLSELVESPTLFKGGVRPGDILQGQLGSCFLLGALGAVVSNNPKAIKKMFIKHDIQVGVYGVRFCIDGEWTYVIVDDWMPVNAWGTLLFAHSKDPDELWCPLLEKAYCKMKTCYEMCDGGFAPEAIFNFFGGVNGELKITDAHRETPASYTQVVRQARKRGWLLTTSFKPKGALSAEGSGKCGEETFDSGLVGGHCYSVLRTVEAHGNSLICIRNPWGSGEWKGKWSDKNEEEEWTDEMREACGYTGEPDGKFWMSMEDFLETTRGVQYARSFGPNWKKTTHYKHFQQSPMLGTAQWAYEARADDEISLEKGGLVQIISVNPGWWYGHPVGDEEKKGFFPGNYVRLNERPVARFDLVGTVAEGIEGPMTAVVMLIQPDAERQRRFYQRKEDGLNYKDKSYPLMKMVIVNAEGKVHAKKVARGRCIWCELKLPGDSQWRVYAYSGDGLGSAFSLRAYVKDGTATLTEIPGTDISELQAAINNR